MEIIKLIGYLLCDHFVVNSGIMFTNNFLNIQRNPKKLHHTKAYQSSTHVDVPKSNEDRRYTDSFYE